MKQLNKHIKLKLPISSQNEDDILNKITLILFDLLQFSDEIEFQSKVAKSFTFFLKEWKSKITVNLDWKVFYNIIKLYHIEEKVE